jgi:hypothetical protein
MTCRKDAKQSFEKMWLVHPLFLSADWFVCLRLALPAGN